MVEEEKSTYTYLLAPRDRTDLTEMSSSLPGVNHKRQPGSRRAITMDGLH